MCWCYEPPKKTSFLSLDKDGRRRVLKAARAKIDAWLARDGLTYKEDTDEEGRRELWRMAINDVLEEEWRNGRR